MHDSIIIYSRSDKFKRHLLQRDEKQTSRYNNLDNDIRGPWAADNYIGNNSKHERPTLWYPITHPLTGQNVWPKDGTVWRYSQDKHKKIESENRLYWGPNKNYARPRIKKYLYEIQEGVVPSTWWPFNEVGHNDEAQKETADILGPKVFTTPKPLRLLRRALGLSTNGAEEIVLDFFAGSGSIGQAVMEQNASDGGNRVYMLVQLPEPLNVDVGGQTVAVEFCDRIGRPRNVAELTKERLRRAGAKLLTENADLVGKLDVGFRAFRADSANLRNTRVSPAEARQGMLEGLISHIKDDRTDEDLLFGALLRWGVDLTLPVARRELLGRSIWLVDPPAKGEAGAALIACFARPTNGAGGINVELADALAALKPLRVLFRDDGFASDAMKENVASRLKQRAPDTTLRVL